MLSVRLKQPGSQVAWRIVYNRGDARLKRPPYAWEIYYWGGITGGVAMTNAQAYDSIRHFIAWCNS